MLATTTAHAQFASPDISGPLFPGPQAPMPWSPNPDLPLLTASVLGAGQAIQIFSVEEIEAFMGESSGAALYCVWFTWD